MVVSDDYHILVNRTPSDFIIVDGVVRARVATKILFDVSLTDLRAEEATRALNGDPRLQSCSRNEAVGQLVTKLAAQYGLVGSGGK